jgi:hypothetical protein
VVTYNKHEETLNKSIQVLVYHTKTSSNLPDILPLDYTEVLLRLMVVDNLIQHARS